MKASDIPANKFPIPFASGAAAGNVRAIPITSSDPNAASLTLGFPPNTFIPVNAGGTAPDGRDMNGIQLEGTAWSRWMQAGGAIPWDSAFSSLIGGYPAGAIVAAVAIGYFWQSQVDDNVTNPETGGAGWKQFSVIGQATSPTNTVLKAGSGTYVPPAGCLSLSIRMVPGGGGGGGSGTTTGGAGSDGTASSFGTVAANPGRGGAPGNTTVVGGAIIGGLGGAGGTGGSGSAQLRQPGNTGAFGGSAPNVSGGATGPGGVGGATAFFAGAGIGGSNVVAAYSPGGNAPANTGGGGGGAAPQALNGYSCGGGGGGGEYVEIGIGGPAASYPYTVGVGGNGGTAGTNGFAGGNGAAGQIIIEERYG